MRSNRILPKSTIWLKMPISIKTLRVFTKAYPRTKGQRLYSSQSHDQKKNFQIDKGATISDTEEEVIFQVDMDAKNAGEKSAQKDSHRIFAKCVIDPSKVDAEKAKLDLEETFRANN
ncbi:hypothetical protein N7499_011031 [Penicillium canescens]|nr:hypothetical protein N7499_011031 [Penicillium canescens]KAJ6182805.1 hypothetical protein N7485_001447 [Penicillium canescens]